ncbi:hypothetical protein ISG33_08875 [Glaciecola sp. MH2013]|uniref:lipase secretion chaperone n=1 Tax=Glaciecola sp. MH2013 TaxID=2785524 RepID=UPI00189E811B|nr:lipase secretion chaperone [Glaciecola sp. MH2013]MBF7073506.1 hypothetical protein [Glaciecola sp. MH2013]
MTRYKPLTTLIHALLLLASLSLVYAHIQLHQTAHLGHGDAASREWRQPDELNDNFPMPVGSAQFTLDFSLIEERVWRADLSTIIDSQSDVDSAHRKSVDGSLLSLLEDISALYSEDEISRLQLLIKKAKPGNSGETLAGLLMQYRAYSQQEAGIEEEIAKANKQQKVGLLKDYPQRINALQRKYFGEAVAYSLFARQNISKRYLYKRQMINLQTTLSEDKKYQALKEAEASYRIALDGLSR